MEYLNYVGYHLFKIAYYSLLGYVIYKFLRFVFRPSDDYREKSSMDRSEDKEFMELLNEESDRRMRENHERESAATEERVRKTRDAECAANGWDYHPSDKGFFF